MSNVHCSTLKLKDKDCQGEESVFFKITRFLRVNTKKSENKITFELSLQHIQKVLVRNERKFNDKRAEVYTELSLLNNILI